MDITRILYGHHMDIIWILHRYHTAILWTSHGYNMDTQATQCVRLVSIEVN